MFSVVIGKQTAKCCDILIENKRLGPKYMKVFLDSQEFAASNKNSIKQPNLSCFSESKFSSQWRKVGQMVPAPDPAGPIAQRSAEEQRAPNARRTSGERRPLGPERPGKMTRMDLKDRKYPLVMLK